MHIVASQISGVAAAHSSRWHRDRLHRGFMALIAEGRIDPAPLVTQVMPVDDVARAFAVVAERPSDLLQAVLDFQVTAA